MQDQNTDFAKLCISPRPFGSSMVKAPLTVIKAFEHQGRQNLCTLNVLAAFTGAASECNFVIQKCQDSIKAIVKIVKSQIQKGAIPETAARHGYEKTSGYLDILN